MPPCESSPGERISKRIKVCNGAVCDKIVVLKKHRGIRCAELRCASPRPGVVIIAIDFRCDGDILKRAMINYSTCSMEENDIALSPVKVAVIDSDLGQAPRPSRWTGNVNCS